MNGQQFDYVIVGAGSAGCVLAHRMSEDKRHRVLVLEYGGSDRSMLIQMPAALSHPMNMDRYDWGYATEPEPHLGGRVMATPRGKVLGGSSSINGMVYVRGNPADYDRWEAEGARGWAYRDVLPYFRRAETYAAGGDAYRGESGPLHTSHGRLANPLYRAWIEAGRQAGYAVSQDVNGFQQEGFGRMDMTVHRGRRWSTANAYLRPAMHRPNLRLETHALATKISFEGRRARGVTYRQGDATHTVTAAREVLLCGGPINSPHLLKLSGIGPAAELSALGIEVLADRQGVGENLQDHLESYFQVAVRQPITLYPKMNKFAKILIGAQWVLTKQGLGATNHFESCGFIRSRPGVPYPDIQFHFLPLAVRYDGRAVQQGHSMQAHVGPMRSKSRGWVRLRSADARDRPRIMFNYMSHAEDWIEARACVRLTREIFEQPAFDPYRGEEISPGSGVTTDEQIDAFIRDHAESAYHPCGTCRMGSLDDPGAVVDPQGRVIGVDGLRVVDSSIMPSLTTGNLNAPTIMIGEKCADAILGRPPLAPSNAPTYQAAGWETAQR